MAEIVAVTFKEGGKSYYFAPGKGEYEKGMGVIVETARGIEYATVVTPRAEVDDDKLKLPLKPVVRIATPRDEENRKRLIERRAEAIRLAKEKIRESGLGMKLIDCEFAFDGSKATFYFSAPERVDFRELVKELSSALRLRIEMRQVGIRDEIKLLGGLAPCGRECCCSSYLSDVGKVSIKMAKYQGLSLNPTKISGLCGRLMCCLAYENEYYSEAYKQMPRVGTEISTPAGNGFVVNVNMLKMQVRVRIDDKSHDTVSFKDFTLDELNGAPPAPKEAAKDARDTEAAEPASEGEKLRPIPQRGDRDRGRGRDKPRNRGGNASGNNGSNGNNQNNGKNRQNAENGANHGGRGDKNRNRGNQGQDGRNAQNGKPHGGQNGQGGAPRPENAAGNQNGARRRKNHGKPAHAGGGNGAGDKN